MHFEAKNKQQTVQAQAISKIQSNPVQGSNFNEIDSSLRALRKGKNGMERIFLFDSKNSRTTNQSQCDLNDTFGAIHDKNILDFTFNHLQQDHLDAKQKKFTHESPFSVIIYGILFNHLHLQGLDIKLPKLTQLSSLLVKHLRAAFIQQEDSINQKQPEVGFSALEVAQLLSGVYGKTTNQKERLTQIIKKIDCQGIENVVKEVIRAEKKTNPGKVYTPKRTLTVGQDKENSSTLHYMEEISHFANLFDIKIKLYGQQGKKYFGPKSSPLTISLKHCSRKNMYSLKEISCNDSQRA